MRFYTTFTLLVATACGPNVKPTDDTAPDSNYVGPPPCNYEGADTPRNMQAGANNELRLELQGPYPGVSSQRDYDRIGEPYPEFRILTLMVPVGADRRIPEAPVQAPTLDGWTEEVVRDLPDDTYFRLAFDVTPPAPGPWVLYTRAEIPGVTDYAGLCFFLGLTETAWEPEPPVAGWRPGRMVWIDAE